MASGLESLTYRRFTKRQVAIHAGFTAAAQIASRLPADAGPTGSQAADEPGFHGEFTKAGKIAGGSRVHQFHHQEAAMQNPKGQFRIELTPDQKAKIREATGKDAEAVELSVEELEERIAPRKLA